MINAPIMLPVLNATSVLRADVGTVTVIKAIHSGAMHEDKVFD